MGHVAGKRERTQMRLAECALELFESNGFEQTTVAEIASAAGVTPMTFFRHFASKQRVLLDDPYDPVIAAAVAAMPLAWSPLRRTVGALRSAWAALPEPETGTVRRRVRIVARTRSLSGEVAANNEEKRRLIVAQLVTDGADPLAANVAAAATLAAVTAGLFEWAQSGAGSLGRVVTAALDVLEVDHG